MFSFSKRSNEKELLDGLNIPMEQIRRNMYELDVINSRLGGHAITLRGLKQVLKHRVNTQPVHVVEIGCGGGDNLRVVKRWAQKSGQAARLTGIDINPDCVDYAASRAGSEGIDFICDDYKTAKFAEPPDVIFSSLFCHHFSDEELVFMLRWMQQHTTAGFFINDLHRHPLAYYSIKTLTRLFSESDLVKNDAPLSVKRSFTRGDWQRYFSAAGIHHFSCRWQWAFRWLITYTHDEATNI